MRFDVRTELTALFVDEKNELRKRSWQISMAYTCTLYTFTFISVQQNIFLDLIV